MGGDFDSADENTSSDNYFISSLSGVEKFHFALFGTQMLRRLTALNFESTL